MPRPNKIIKLGLEKEVLELRGKGLGLREIAQELTRRHRTYFSHMCVSNYLKSSKKIFGEVELMSEQYKEKTVDTIYEIHRKLNNLINATWVLLNYMVKTNDWSMVVRMMERAENR